VSQEVHADLHRRYLGRDRVVFIALLGSIWDDVLRRAVLRSTTADLVEKRRRATAVQLSYESVGPAPAASITVAQNAANEPHVATYHTHQTGENVSYAVEEIHMPDLQLPQHIRHASRLSISLAYPASLSLTGVT